MSAQTSSTRPYLIRAMVEWMSDNALTPHLVVDVSQAGVVVPDGYADEDGRITLNISAGATEGLVLGNQLIEFSARFAGTIRSLSVPPSAVVGIYARETGEGIRFDVEGTISEGEPPGPDGDGDDDGSGPGGDGRPNLRVVR